uniref:Kinase n=1 Tax=Daphnia magna TaxID=35525 RepID=A0A0P5D4I3_9CRUS
MIDQGISVCYCPNRLKNGFRSRVAMRIDRPSCSCRQHSTRELSTFYNSLELPQCPTTRRSWNNRGISKKSLSTPDLLMSHQRPQRHQTCSDPDHVPADSHDPSGRRRCRSLSLGCLCMKRTLVAMASGWLHGYQSAQQEEMGAASDEDISSGSSAAASGTAQQQQQQPHQQEQQSRVCTSLSWDSGYNECATELGDAFSPVNRRLTGPMRMPSVVVSDCSDDPNENGDTVILANGYYRLSELPSPTLSSHSSSGHDTAHEMDQAETHAASWSWATSHRAGSNGLLILPGQGLLDEDPTMASSLLSVRRLSDCSSCSSLATLDMEPCCPGPCTAQSHATSFQTDPDQSFRLGYDLTQDGVEETSETPKKEDARLSSEDYTSSPKVSAWRKVRSAVQWSPFVQTFRRQRYPWVQLAGHQGNFKLGGERGTILKKLCPKEESCFQLLMKDPLRPFIPSYKGNVTSDDGEKFLVLEDLLGDFRNPAVMDCKLGVRTYLEDELAKAKLKPKLRKDMFEKMLQVDPSAPTAEELRMGGVTKPRYMIWRETISSTASLGFRIEGIRKQDGSSSKDYKTVGSPQQIVDVLRDFVRHHPHALTQYIARLNQLEETLTRSDFFATHELIGTSLLFVHDHNKANIWMIDFAKTHRLPAGVQIDHRSPWCVGNHEDGYLVGMSNLTQLLEQLLVNRDQSQSNPT